MCASALKRGGRLWLRSLGCPMPRTFAKGIKFISPSGLPCVSCGILKSSGWRGPRSRFCARRRCKAQALLAALAKGNEAAAPSPPPMGVVGPIITAPYIRGEAIGDVAVAMAVPLAVPTDVPLANPPVALAAAVAMPTASRPAKPAAMMPRPVVVSAVPAATTAVPLAVPMDVPLAKPPVALATAIAMPTATRAAEPAAVMAMGAMAAAVPATVANAGAADPAAPLPPPPQAEEARRAPLSIVNGNALLPMARAKPRAAAAPPPPLSAYEVERAGNVERNQAVLRALGLLSPLIPTEQPKAKQARVAKPPPPTTRTLRPTAAPRGIYAEGV